MKMTKYTPKSRKTPTAQPNPARKQGSVTAKSSGAVAIPRHHDDGVIVYAAADIPITAKNRAVISGLIPSAKLRATRGSKAQAITVVVPSDEHNEPRKKYKSSVFASIHEAMSDLDEAGMLDKRTMRQVDEAAVISAEPMTPDRIRALRRRENVSQPVFAIYLNVSKNLISDWERGTKKPGGPACRLLEVVERNGIEILATD